MHGILLLAKSSWRPDSKPLWIHSSHQTNEHPACRRQWGTPGPHMSELGRMVQCTSSAEARQSHHSYINSCRIGASSLAAIRAPNNFKLSFLPLFRLNLSSDQVVQAHGLVLARTRPCPTRNPPVLRYRLCEVPGLAGETKHRPAECRR